MTDHPLAATAACVFDAYGTLFDLRLCLDAAAARRAGRQERTRSPRCGGTSSYDTARLRST